MAISGKAVTDTDAGGDGGDARGRRRGLRRFVPLAVLGAGLAAFLALGLQDSLGFEALRARHAELVALAEGHGVLASLGFMAVYAASVAFSIPGATVLTLIGGFLFGVVWGSVLVVASATLGATAVFLAARMARGEGLRRRAAPWLGRLEDGFRRDAFNYMLTLRLVPVVPFWLLNLVPALLGVPLRSFVLSTLVGIIPGTVVYVSIGSGLGATLEAGGTPDLGIVLRPQILLPLLGLAVLSLLPVVYRRMKGQGRP